jgi:YesN/AraC family two-component response regulator
VIVEQVGKYLGKTIEDSMGRPVGKLVGLTADIKDEVTAIQIVHNDGEVVQHSINFVTVLEDRLILQSTWRVEAEDLRREHDIIVRRRQALDLLLKDGDIDQSEFEQLRSTYESLDKEIKEKSETLIDTLKRMESKLDQQISDLQSALTNNKMLYSSSEISERIYQEVTGSIRSGLDTARKERKDIANIMDYQKSKETAEPPQIPQITASPLENKELTSPQELPQMSPSNVVVIKINEVSKI